MPETIRQFAEQVILVEAQAVERMKGAVCSAEFERAARMMLACKGAVVTTGMGKAGHVARKLAATLASTGTPSHFLSPTDAMHGDLGSVRPGDIVIIMSASGESDEIIKLLDLIVRLEHPVIALTATKASGLGRDATVVIEMGKIEEACPLGLAPSASTTAMLALGDALALSVMKLRNFTSEDFAMYHPAGQLGRKLIRVSEAMTFRRGENLPVASDGLTVGQVLHEVAGIKRRSGAVVLMDKSGKLSGLFSDGDLRRLVTDDDGSALARPIGDVMTRNPKRILESALASEALAVMRHHRIDELPVVDAQDKPVGLIDVQDLVVLKMLDADDAVVF